MGYKRRRTAAFHCASRCAWPLKTGPQHRAESITEYAVASRSMSDDKCVFPLIPSARWRDTSTDPAVDQSLIASEMSPNCPSTLSFSLFRSAQTLLGLPSCRARAIPQHARASRALRFTLSLFQTLTFPSGIPPLPTRVVLDFASRVCKASRFRPCFVFVADLAQAPVRSVRTATAVP